MRLTLIIMLFIQNAFAQQIDSLDSFTAGKKSIQLSTGIDMKYIETGNPAGRIILLLHGLTDTSRSFETVIAEILKVDRNLRILAPDLRGHGTSSMPDFKEINGFSINSVSKDILDFMHQKGITEVDLVGHSFGSIIAQEIALNYPDKVSTLTLIGTFIDGRDNPALHDILIGQMLEGWKQELIARYGDDWERKSYSKAPRDLGKEVEAYLRQNWVNEINTSESYLNAVHLETIAIPFGTWFRAFGVVGSFDNTHKFQELKTPTLIIWGEGDEFFPRSPDQELVIALCEMAAEQHNTAIFYKSYGRVENNSRPMGHNLHWGIPKNIAADILTLVNEGGDLALKLPGKK